jgi:tetratricopeptide (TPR) repeat protein
MASYNSIMVKLVKTAVYVGLLASVIEAPFRTAAANAAPIEDSDILSIQAIYAARVGDSARSLALLAKTLVAYPSTPDGTLLKARCCRNVAFCLLQASCPAEAIDIYDRALSLYLAPVAVPQEIAECYSDSGTAARILGRSEDALRRFENAWHLIQNDSDATQRRGQYLINTSTALADMGQYEDAFARLTEAKEYFRDPSNKGREIVACMMNMAVILTNLGAYEKALAEYDQASGILDGIQGMDKIQASLKNSAGILLTDIGRYNEAIRNYREAIKFHLSIPDSEEQQAGCYINLVRTLELMGLHEEAIKQLYRAFRLSQNFRIHPIVARKCLFNLTRIHLNNHQYEQAVDCLDGASDGWTHWELSWLSAKVFAARNDLEDNEQGLRYFLEAVKGLERKRSLIFSEEYRMSFFDDKVAIFSDFTSFWVDRRPIMNADMYKDLGLKPEQNRPQIGWADLAFHVIERGKGRGLTDQLREKAIMKAVRPDARLLARQRSLSQQISKLTSLRNDLPETETKRRKDLTAKIDELQQEWNMIEVELKRTALGG